jgi:hypothetical protein
MRDELTLVRASTSQNVHMLNAPEDEEVPSQCSFHEVTRWYPYLRGHQLHRR